MHGKYSVSRMGKWWVGRRSSQARAWPARHNSSLLRKYAQHRQERAPSHGPLSLTSICTSTCTPHSVHFPHGLRLPIFEFLLVCQILICTAVRPYLRGVFTERCPLANEMKGKSAERAPALCFVRSCPGGYLARRPASSFPRPSYRLLFSCVPSFAVPPSPQIHLHRIRTGSKMLLSRQIP